MRLQGAGLNVFCSAFTRNLCTKYIFSNLPCFILDAFCEPLARLLHPGQVLNITVARSLHRFCRCYVDRSPKYSGPCSRPTPLVSSYMRQRAARSFGAAKKAIFALKSYYEHVYFRPFVPSVNTIQPSHIQGNIPLSKTRPLRRSITCANLIQTSFSFCCMGIRGVKFVRQRF